MSQGTFTADDILDAHECGALLGRPASTIKDWARQGVIPARKRGKFWFFLRPEIEAWITAPDND